MDFKKSLRDLKKFIYFEENLMDFEKILRILKKWIINLKK